MTQSLPERLALLDVAEDSQRYASAVGREFKVDGFSGSDRGANRSRVAQEFPKSSISGAMVETFVDRSRLDATTGVSLQTGEEVPILAYAGDQEAVKPQERFDLDTVRPVDYLNTDNNVNLDPTVNAQSSQEGMAFSSDGSVLFITSETDGEITTVELSEPYNLSTASKITTESFSTLTSDGGAFDVELSRDGTRMYIADGEADEIVQFDMSTPLDITTASESGTLNVQARADFPKSITVKEDGTKMFAAGTVDDNLAGFDLSTPFDITTASPTGNEQGLGNLGVVGTHHITEDGRYLIAISFRFKSRFGVWELDTPYDLSTANFRGARNISDLIGSEPREVVTGPDDRVYVLSGFEPNAYRVSDANGTSSGIIELEFGRPTEQGALRENKDLSLPENGNFDSPPSNVVVKQDADIPDNATLEYEIQARQSLLNVATTTPGEVTGTTSVAFNNDGTRLYLATTTQDIQSYELGTPFDIRTRTARNRLDIAGSTASPLGLDFSSDGTKMYVLDTGDEEIDEYDLTTAFDVSTATLSQSLDLSPTTTQPTGLHIGPQDKNVYLVDDGDTIQRYRLFDPQDITRAFRATELDISDSTTDAVGVSLHQDGLSMTVSAAESLEGRIIEFTLSEGFDLLSATRSSSGVMTAQTDEPADITLGDGDEKLYTAVPDNDTLASFTSPTPNTVTTVGQDDLRQTVQLGGGMTTDAAVRVKFNQPLGSDERLTLSDFSVHFQ